MAQAGIYGRAYKQWKDKQREGRPKQIWIKDGPIKRSLGKISNIRADLQRKRRF